MTWYCTVLLGYCAFSSWSALSWGRQTMPWEQQMQTFFKVLKSGKNLFCPVPGTLSVRTDTSFSWLFPACLFYLCFWALTLLATPSLFQLRLLWVTTHVMWLGWEWWWWCRRGSPSSCMFLSCWETTGKDREGSPSTTADIPLIFWMEQGRSDSGTPYLRSARGSASSGWGRWDMRGEGKYHWTEGKRRCQERCGVDSYLLQRPIKFPCCWSCSIIWKWGL